MADIPDIKVIKPGPADRPRVDRVAAKLSKKTPEEAEITRKKALASAKKDDLVFMDETHIFYPYFCMKLREFRANPAAADEVTAAPAPSAALQQQQEAEQQAVVAPAIAAEQEEKEKRSQLLAVAQEEGKRHVEDPHPNVYNLKVERGVAISAMDFESMSLIAQWAARLGPVMSQKMVDQLCSGSSSTRQAFPFLQSSNPLHVSYQSLVDAYTQILRNGLEDTPAASATEVRLGDLSGSVDHIRQMCEEKQRFVESEIARQKASILTEPELMERLNKIGAWRKFTVMHSFTLDELELTDGTAQMMSAMAAAPFSASTGAQQQLVVEESPVVGVAHGVGGGIKVVDNSGAAVNISEVAQSIKANTMNMTQHQKDQERAEKRKRDALECLADDAEQSLNAKNMRQEV